MKEKASKSQRSQRTSFVMDCNDFVVFAFLLMACCSTTVFAYGQELNGPCTLYTECHQPGYKCAGNRTCQCGNGYIPNENWSKCVGFVGSNCVYDSHCMEGAYCKGSDGFEKCKCKTKEGFYVSEDGLRCTNSTPSSHHQRFSPSILLLLLGTSLYLNT